MATIGPCFAISNKGQDPRVWSKHWYPQIEDVGGIKFFAIEPRDTAFIALLGLPTCDMHERLKTIRNDKVPD